MSGEARTGAALRDAVFVDRDGTLMEDVPYIRDPAAVRIFPGVSEALRRLKAAGFVIVMATNQSGIGRGWNTVEQFDAVQARFFELLGANLIDAVYMCPDAPGAPSRHRKPEPGMLFDAARELGLDLHRSWMIGDKPADVECGMNAGARPIQVLTGEGAAHPSEKALQQVVDFSAAADFVLRTSGPVTNE